MFHFHPRQAAIVAPLALLAWLVLAGSANTSPVSAAPAVAGATSTPRVAAPGSGPEVDGRACGRDPECNKGKTIRTEEALAGSFFVHERTIVPEKFLGRGAALENGADAIVIEGGEARTLSGCQPAPLRAELADGQWTVAVEWKDCAPGVSASFEGGIDAATAGTLAGHVHLHLPARPPDAVQDFPIIATLAHNEAIRIGAYNTMYLPDSVPVDYDKYPADATVKMSERILASHYDIISLEEVWDEDAKSSTSDPKGFVQLLSPTYPYYVEYLSTSAGDVSFHEDSGIMLFSRFPFVPLLHDDYVLESGDCVGSSCDRVAYIEFDGCDDDDCMAEKGAGLVRIQNPATHRIYNVVFTHLQAPYYDDPPDEMVSTMNTRHDQLGYIRTLLEATLDPVSFLQEEVYVMGDLNIDGNLANLNLGAPPPNPPDTSQLHHNKYEWAKEFSKFGSFWTDRMRDLWAYDTSPKDLGLSAPINYQPYFSPPGARLDYILANQYSRLCTQHMTLAHNLRWGMPYVESGLGQPGTGAGTMEMSDHIGVTADINLPAPFCSARTPWDQFLKPGDDAAIDSELMYDGSMQWFRFNEPGTYGFATSSQGPVDFQVFAEDDLSMPMANYKELTRTATINRQDYELKMFLVPKAPFYVRVYVKDFSGWHGDYRLLAKSYDCSSKEDSCLLEPGTPEFHAFPGGQYMGSEDAMWYELHTEATGWDYPDGTRVTTSSPQNLEFEVDRITPADPDQLTMQVRDANGAAVLAEDTNAFADPDEPTFDRLYAQRMEAGPNVRYIRVKRLDPALPQLYRVAWRTNLTVLAGSQVGLPGAQPLDFSINDHGDPFGDEEYYFWLLADGATVVDAAHIDEQSEPSHVSLEPYITAVRFTDQVNAYWVEVDDGFDGTYDVNEVVNDDVIHAAVNTLSPSVGSVLNRSVKMHDDEGDGTYHFRYSLTHGLATP